MRKITRHSSDHFCFILFFFFFVTNRAKSISSNPWGARLTLVLVAFLYGTNYAAIKFMGGLMDPSTLMTLRFGLAALVLLPSLRGVGRDVLLSGAEVGVYSALGYGGQAFAMTVRSRGVAGWGMEGERGRGGVRLWCLLWPRIPIYNAWTGYYYLA